VALDAEDEIRESPIARMRPLVVPDEPPPVLRAEELERLLAACAGTGLEDRRDTAIIRLLASTGGVGAGGQLRQLRPRRSPLPGDARRDDGLSPSRITTLFRDIRIGCHIPQSRRNRSCDRPLGMRIEQKLAS